MKNKLNNALSNIDESLIYEAANADRAEHKALRTIRNIALPVAAAAAVFGIAAATKDVWIKYLPESNSTGVSLVESDPQILSPSTSPVVQPENDAISNPPTEELTQQERLANMLSDVTDRVGLVPPAMTDEKNMAMYFGSEFPDILYASDEIVAFSNGFGTALYFYDTAKETPENERLLLSLDLEGAAKLLRNSPDTDFAAVSPGDEYSNGFSLYVIETNDKPQFFFNIYGNDADGKYTSTAYRIAGENGALFRMEEDEMAEIRTGGKLLEQTLLGSRISDRSGNAYSIDLDFGKFSMDGLLIQKDSLSGFDAFMPLVPYSKYIPDGRDDWVMIQNADGELSIRSRAHGKVTADFSYETMTDGSLPVTGVQKDEFNLLDGVTKLTPAVKSEDTPMPDDKQIDPIDFPDGIVLIHPLAKYSYTDRQNINSENLKYAEYIAPEGTPVYAAAEGKVILSEWYNEYGNCVIIEHGSGVSTVYGHLRECNVSEGEDVKQGDVIGSVGTTGLTTESLLHFEIRLNDEEVSPEYVPFFEEDIPEVFNTNPQSNEYSEEMNAVIDDASE